MPRKITGLLLVLALLLSISATAYADTLNVSGKNFSFKVIEPSGWQGITSDANNNRVNLYFPMPGHDFNSSPVLMYVRVLNKNGNTVKKNLELDMDDFLKRNQIIEFFEFPVKNLNYEYAAKKYLINNNQVDYLCYIDPAIASPNYVVFVLTGPKESCENYLDIFKALIQSFRWLNIEVSK